VHSNDGLLIVNADDWGRDALTTDMIAGCVSQHAVSSVSAMVFMEDSERAAAIARANGIDAGLHLNLTTPFTSSGADAQLVKEQRAIARFLRSHRLAQAVFHPGLARAFTNVVRAQLEEYRRLYDRDAERVDGHHHMHLCANVLVQRLLPPRSMVRRSFSFQRGEKSGGNRLYRRLVDRVLVRRRHRLTDYFFCIAPLEPPERLNRVIALSERAVVELETHPAHADEYQFLTGGGFLRRLGDASIATRWDTRKPFR